jgi:hypothetical protein
MLNNRRVEYEELGNRNGDTFRLIGNNGLTFTVLDIKVIYNPNDFTPSFSIYTLKKPFIKKWLTFNEIYESNDSSGILHFVNSKYKHVSKIVSAPSLLIEKKLKSIYYK